MDLTIFNTLHDLAGQSRLFDGLMIFFANYLGYFLIAGFLIFLWKEKNVRRRWGMLLFTILAALLSRGLITETIRFFYDRPRPFEVLNFTPLISHDPAFSFPSGHAVFYFALAFVALYFNSYSHNYGYSYRNAGWLFLVGVILIGVSRVAVGVHWPLDIVVGAVIGLLSFFAVKYLLVFLK